MSKPRKKTYRIGTEKWCAQRAQEKAIGEVIREAWRRAIAKADDNEDANEIQGERE